MTLSLDDVEHIARLAHLSLSDAEKALYREQLSSILDFAQQLQELDTDAIPPTASILPINSVMRSDESNPSTERQEFLTNAPAAMDGMYRVPPILE